MDIKGNEIAGYQLLREITVGTRAEVWYAENKQGEAAAVKVLKKEFAEREETVQIFLTQGEEMQELSHPHIVKVHALGEVEGRPALVMEYLDGQTIGSLLATGETFAPDTLTHLWNQVVSALTYAHKRDKIHANLSPDNIFACKDGKIKLLNFAFKHCDEVSRLPGVTH